MKATKSQLRTQLIRARQLGWLPHFEEAAESFDWPIEVLLGVGSRETNLDPKYLRVPGDNGNGFGLMQVDRRSDPVWCASGAWKDARKSILRGTEMLAEKRRRIIEREGKKITVRSSRGVERTFRMPRLDGRLLDRVAIAAYNCGDWASYHISQGNPIDRGTTGGDYSLDVLERAEVFRALLDEMQPAEVAVETEIDSSSEVAVDADEQNPDSIATNDGQNSDTPAPAVASALAAPAKSTMAAVGKKLFGGYKRILGWLSGLGLVASDHWIALLIGVVVAGGAVFYWRKSLGRVIRRIFNSEEKS